ncbi:MAG: methylated-DNA--[protein]-cysteine S-methyltransferase [Candidatus Didemnitutus sp.]|nr:methylated-DNA--[protein]-cysteine S-methyltransferase [Candidatus Didemnitutus sp.]
MPHAIFPTAFGTCGLAWNETGLTGFQLPEATAAETEQQLAARAFTQAAAEPLPDWLPPLIARVQAHCAGQMQDFADVALDWSRVSDFQRAVYEQTVAIKAGYKRSYGDIAAALKLGPAAARAVGTALGANPWPLIVPCHRVVSASDKMTGFSGPGGVRTKTRLLALEGAELLSE